MEELGASGRQSGNMSAGEFSENRYDMPWERVNDEKYNHILEHYKALLSVRDSILMYSKGTSEKLAGGNEDKFVIIGKTYENTELLVAINKM